MANVKVQAIMTAPRAEITWCRNQIEKAMNELRIPLSVSGGVYYGQCMQMMLEDAIDQGVEYAITVDGDSVFTGDQVHHLISLAVQEDMDALCAMQLRRGKPHMLGHRFGEVSGVWDGYPMQVDTAHFGLTVLNLKKTRCCRKALVFLPARRKRRLARQQDRFRHLVLVPMEKGRTEVLYRLCDEDRTR